MSIEKADQKKNRSELDSLTEETRNAYMAKNWPETLRLSSCLLAKDPDYVYGFIYGVSALKNLKQLGEAKNLCREGLNKFPRVRHLLKEGFLIARRLEDWEMAAELGTVYTEIKPLEHLGYKYAVEALFKLKQKSSAEELIAKAEKIIGDEDFVAGLKEAAPQPEASRAESAGQGSSEVAMKPVRRGNNNPGPAIMGAFQSLGSTRYGFEFGQVQQYFGLAPPDLFRFSTAAVDSLTSILKSDLETIWRPEDLSLAVGRPETGEYYLKSNKYDFSIRTFIYAAETDAADGLALVLEKLSFWARRFKALFEAGPPLLFVHKTYPEDTPEEQLEALHEVLAGRRHSLFSVRPAGPDHPAGTVDMIKPNLAHGYINVADEDLYHRSHYESWLDVCRLARKSLGQA